MAMFASTCLPATSGRSQVSRCSLAGNGAVRGRAGRDTRGTEGIRPRPATAGSQKGLVDWEVLQLEKKKNKEKRTTNQEGDAPTTMNINAAFLEAKAKTQEIN